MPNWLERTYPYIISVIVASTGIYFLASDARNLPDALNELVSALISVSSITIGFLATAKTIVISIDNDTTIKQLKDVGHYDTIRQYIVEAINVSFALLVLSMLALILNIKPKPDKDGKIVLDGARYVFFWLWVFSMVGTGLACYRVLALLSAILKGRDTKK